MKPNYTMGRSSISLMLGGTGEPDTIVWMFTHPGDADMGRFKELFAQVLSDADKEGVTLLLRLVPEVGGGRTISAARLADRLKAEGFVSENNKDFMRLPKGKESK
jgi:hypothetical protein